jgi:hypothetical protein
LSTASYVAGAQVSIDGLGDCENCEVAKSQPSEDNEIVFEVYDRLPKSYDGWSGNQLITVADITGVLKLMLVPEDQWDGIYNRLIFFQREIIEARMENKNGRG